MGLRPWRDRLDRELARRGVPAGYRSRLLAELGDHLHDLTDEGNDMTEVTLDATVGRPADVAEFAAAEYRKTSWVRRHPFVAFGLLPIPVWFVTVVGFELVFGAVVLGSTGIAGGELSRPWKEGFAVTMVYALRFVPFVLAAAWFGRLAAKHQVRSRWLAVALAELALFAAAFVSSLVLSDVPGQSTISFGLSLPWPESLRGTELAGLFMPPGWSQLAQLIAPLVVGIACVRLARKRQMELAVA